MSGDGSLYRRERTRPNGQRYVRWVAQLSTGPRDDRTVVRRVRRTKAEARAALDEMLGPQQSSLPLGDYLLRWLDETAAPSVAPNTARGYRAVIASAAPIAPIPLAELTAEDVETWLNRLTARRHGQEHVHPASPKTRRNALAMLRRALDVAVRRDQLAHNVARLVEMPRVPRQSRDALTPAVAKDVLEAVKGDRYEAAYALALCGLRSGEVLGLAWSDVDLEAGSVDVKWQIVGSGKRAQRAQLKTRASEAPVPIPPFVVARLSAHRRVQLAERAAAGQPTEEGLVFLTERGYAVSGSWLTKHFQQLLEAAGLPRLRFHDMRHGAATLLVEAGAHPKVAQALLRHSSSRITMDVYSHTTAQQERAASDLLEEMLG